MLGAAETLAEHGVAVDAEVGRQMVDVVDDVIDAAEQGVLGDIVVVHLGTNGSFDEETMVAFFDALADIDRVVVFNIRADRSWTSSNNTLLDTLPERYDNVVLVDWADLVVTDCDGHCLYEDGIHLPPDGRRFYTDLVVAAAGL